MEQGTNGGSNGGNGGVRRNSPQMVQGIQIKRWQRWLGQCCHRWTCASDEPGEEP